MFSLLVFCLLPYRAVPYFSGVLPAEKTPNRRVSRDSGGVSGLATTTGLQGRPHLELPSATRQQLHLLVPPPAPEDAHSRPAFGVVREHAQVSLFSNLGRLYHRVRNIIFFSFHALLSGVSWYFAARSQPPKRRSTIGAYHSRRSQHLPHP